jgi:hypothetical protein
MQSSQWQTSHLAMILVIKTGGGVERQLFSYTMPVIYLIYILRRGISL